MVLDPSPPPLYIGAQSGASCHEALYIGTYKLIFYFICIHTSFLTFVLCRSVCSQMGSSCHNTRAWQASLKHPVSLFFFLVISLSISQVHTLHNPSGWQVPLQPSANPLLIILSFYLFVQFNNEFPPHVTPQTFPPVFNFLSLG